MKMYDIWFAFGLTAFAGMATGIGSVVAFTAKRTDYRFLSVATGFSAGVMLYVSFVEIFFKGVDALTAVYGDGPRGLDSLSIELSSDQHIESEASGSLSKWMR